MKKWIFGVLCLALASPAWAQSDTAVQPAPGYTYQVVPAMPLGTIVAQPISGGHGMACAPGCASCNPLKTICVPEPTTKVRVRVLYSSICEKVCYPSPYCPLAGKRCCGQGDCGQPGHGCGQPYTKRYLVKKYCEQEEPVNRCVPVTVPACEANRFAQPAAAGAYYAQPGTTEPLSGTPTPLKK